MTDAELIDAVYAFLWGGGIGVAVTGAFLAVAGVGFFALRSRARRRFEETGVVSQSATSNGILGAIVTVVASFVPFSPVLGGALAGYLESPSRVPGFGAAVSRACSRRYRSSSCSRRSRGPSSEPPRD